jgi:hypothetical protein
MKHFALKNHVRSLVRVVLSELKLQLEKTSLPWGTFDALDDGFPLEEVVLQRGSANSFVVLFFYFLEIFE